MEYKEEMLKSYYSSHYKKLLPDSQAKWKWVIDRLEINLGDYLNSLPKYASILDLPCGVGYMEHYLLGMGFNNISAVDISEEQILAAKEKLKEDGLEYDAKVNFMVADAFETLKEHEGMDVITMIDMIEHFNKDDVIQLLRLAKGSLKDGGLLMLRTVNAESPTFGRFYNDFTHETPFTISSLLQCLTLVGFEVMKVGFEKEPYIGGRAWFGKEIKRGIHRLGLKVLGMFLGIPPGGFSENIVCVVKK